MTPGNKNDASVFEYERFNQMIQRVKDMPNPRQLYKSLFYEGDLGILFGPTHCGKSLFAVMITEEVCKAFKLYGYGDSAVLLIDMEMSEKQHQMRYTNSKTNKVHEFPDTMYRVAFSDYGDGKLTESNMFASFKKAIEETGARALIIDNITYLGKGQRGSSVAIMMKILKHLKKVYGLSILVLAHTPKRNDSRPITIVDLMGSSFISAIADSIFALNKSCKGNDIRYVKQLKSRNSAIEYGADNVLEYKIMREKDGMLRLNLVGTTTEEEQVGIDYIAKEEIENKIRQLNSKCWPVRKIAKKLKISPSKVFRCLH